jgi:ketosteroid isomerase-like protein
MPSRLSAGLLTLALAWPLPVLAQTAETDVRNVVLAVNKAYAQNDLPTYWSHYDPTLTQWWPEGRVELPSYQRQWTDYINTGGRVLAADVSDLQIQVDPTGDAAVATYRLRIKTRNPDKTEATQEIQETDVLFRRERVWKIVHLHYSNVAQPK